MVFLWFSMDWYVYQKVFLSTEEAQAWSGATQAPPRLRLHWEMLVPAGDAWSKVGSKKEIFVGI